VADWTKDKPELIAQIEQMVATSQSDDLRNSLSTRGKGKEMMKDDHDSLTQNQLAAG
jgi:hypothetical protein